MINANDNKTLAGEKFTDDQQCELVFGPGATICSYMPTCSDGTKCGDNLWCQKGHCVARNRSALVPVDGSWGAWSE
jgi:hypothetical protein